MQPPRMLRRLDQRVLPPIGRALAGLSRGARRLRLVMVTASVLSVAIVLVTVYVATRSPADSTRTSAAVTLIGVKPGDSIPAYIEKAQEDLRKQAAGPNTLVLALVTFNRYVKPDAIAAITDGTLVRRVFIHVSIPGQVVEPMDKPVTAIPSDVTRAMLLAAALQRKVEQDFRDKMMKAGNSTDDRKRLLAQYRAKADLAHAEADAYAALCACVYGAVVYATPAELLAVAARPEVRAVDPAPANATFVPPLPEQKLVAG